MTTNSSFQDLRIWQESMNLSVEIPPKGSLTTTDYRRTTSEYFHVERQILLGIFPD